MMDDPVNALRWERVQWWANTYLKGRERALEYYRSKRGDPIWRRIVRSMVSSCRRDRDVFVKYCEVFGKNLF